MNHQDSDRSSNPEVHAAMATLQRAAALARQIAIQTDTAIIIMQDGRRVRVTADELRQQQAAERQ